MSTVPRRLLFISLIRDAAAGTRMASVTPTGRWWRAIAPRANRRNGWWIGWGRWVIPESQVVGVPMFATGFCVYLRRVVARSTVMMVCAQASDGRASRIRRSFFIERLQRTTVAVVLLWDGVGSLLPCPPPPEQLDPSQELNVHKRCPAFVNALHRSHTHPPFLENLCCSQPELPQNLYLKEHRWFHRK